MRKGGFERSRLSNHFIVDQLVTAYAVTGQ